MMKGVIINILWVIINRRKRGSDTVSGSACLVQYQSIHQNRSKQINVLFLVKVSISF